MAILLSLVAGLPLCLILFACMGLPLYMSVVFVAAGGAAALVVRRIAKRVDPLVRLKRFYVLGGLAGAATGLLTNGLFALRFKFRLDAAAVSALLGGVGAVLYGVMSVATERPPKAKRNSEEDARFFRSLGRMARREGAQRWRPSMRASQSTPDLDASSRDDRASEKGANDS